jgi:hypothetical protein
MKLKERERSKLFNSLKKGWDSFVRVLFDSRTKLLFLLGVVFIFFVIGSLFGLLVSGFFGTLDEPSEKALGLVHSFGIYGIGELKVRLGEIKHENFRILPNYIRGQFSKPEKIYIDIAFEDYQKIEYERGQAISSLEFDGFFVPSAGILISSEESYVPAKIRYEGEEVDVKLRLKGDLTDHLDGNKWSFRIKVKGDDSLFGMKTFSIQDPKARGHVKELIYHQALEIEEVLSLRYDFVEVIINGDNMGIYALEEHFGKELIEYNNRREGVIIKFNEDGMWGGVIDSKDSISNYTDYFEYMDENYLDDFYKSNIEPFNSKDITEDESLSRQFETAKNLLEYFRQGSLKTSEVFDVDLLAKYFAINTLMGTPHAAYWNNIRFYYNPINSKLEPIGYDALAYESASKVMDDYFPNCFYNEDCPEIKSFEELIFRDEIFFERYLEELERVSQKEYLDDLFSSLNDEIDRSINILHKDHPTYYFSKDFYYQNQEEIVNRLDSTGGINVYFHEVSLGNKIVFYVGNVKQTPLEIINLVYNNSIYFESVNPEIIPSKPFEKLAEYKKIEFKIPEGFVWNDSFVSDLMINYKLSGTEKILNEKILFDSYIEEDFLEEDFMISEPSGNFSDMLIFNEGSKTISIKKGEWTLEDDLIIPEGYVLLVEKGSIFYLTNSSVFLSYSPVKFSGSENELIKIISNNGQGFAVLNAGKKSYLDYVIFDGLNSPLKEGWELTGGVTFYESPVELNNVKILNSLSEDGLNVVRSKLEIRNSIFENSFSDCLDVDFGEGIIESSLFVNCGNDGLDFSGSMFNISSIELKKIGDKGISGGENSLLDVKNVEVDEGYIGIASKDKSKVFVENSEILNVEYGFTVYQKKSEFGPALLRAKNVNFSEFENKYLLERNSELFIDETIILNQKQNVYDILYPN